TPAGPPPTTTTSNTARLPPLIAPALPERPADPSLAPSDLRAAASAARLSPSTRRGFPALGVGGRPQQQQHGRSELPCGVVGQPATAPPRTLPLREAAQGGARGEVAAQAVDP